MKLYTTRKQKISRTEFSDFFRYSSAQEKKKVFTKVIKASSEAQQEIIKQAYGS